MTGSEFVANYIMHDSLINSEACLFAFLPMVSYLIARLSQKEKVAQAAFSFCFSLFHPRSSFFFPFSRGFSGEQSGDKR